MVRVSRTRWACTWRPCSSLFGLAGRPSPRPTSPRAGSPAPWRTPPRPPCRASPSRRPTRRPASSRWASPTRSGFYRILNLPTGTYNVTATLDGFATATAEQRPPAASARRRRVNFTLQSARVSETITVTAEAPTGRGRPTPRSAPPSRPSRSRTCRSPAATSSNLVLLTPETRLDSERGNLSISGQRGINTNVTVDGVDYNNAFFGGTTGAAEGRAPLSISQESIKEFSVITNGASVEFGRSGGGFVNVITKSGTNNLHGSGFYYNQPQSLISDFASHGARQLHGTTKPADQKKDAVRRLAGRRDRQGQALLLPLLRQPEAGHHGADLVDRARPGRLRQVSGARLAPPATCRPATATSPSAGSTTRSTTPTGSWRAATSPSTPARTAPPAPRASTASYNGLEGMDSRRPGSAQYSGQFGANLLNDLNLNYVKEDTPRADKGLNLAEIQLPPASAMAR